MRNNTGYWCSGEYSMKMRNNTGYWCSLCTPFVRHTGSCVHPLHLAAGIHPAVSQTLAMRAV